MFVIRNEQLKILEEYIRGEFIDRVAAGLRKNFTRQTAGMDDQSLRKFIEGGIVKASGYGISEEEDVEKYVGLMCTHGADFDTNPKTSWAGEILRPKDTDGIRKMRRLLKRTLLMKEGFL